MKTLHSPLKQKQHKHIRIFWHVAIHANLSLAEIGMLTILKSFHGKLNIIASHDTIAKRAGVSRSTAIRLLEKLHKAGLFKKVRRAIRGNTTSNIYLMQDDLLTSKLAQKYLKKHQNHSVTDDTMLSVSPVTQELSNNSYSISDAKIPSRISHCQLHPFLPIGMTQYRLPRMKPVHSRSRMRLSNGQRIEQAQIQQQGSSLDSFSVLGVKSADRRSSN